MKLAINGGKPIRDKLNYFPKQKYFDDDTKKLISSLLDTQKLSSFRGNAGENFLGGKYIKAFEQAWCNHFSSKHAITVNSATSGLHIACSAIGLKPGDEVIVTPWSMSCSATAPMLYGAKPVFADVEKDYFCIDPDSIEGKITSRTRAIIAVDLFGQPYDMVKVNNIAIKHNLFVIEDAAQAPGAMYSYYKTGQLGSIGVFSFTQGKHMTAGEGGLITTEVDELAEKCRLLRNHAEAVVSDSYHYGDNHYIDYKKMFGFNMRMTELQAIILLQQLRTIESNITLRNRNVAALSQIESMIPPIKMARVREKCTHSYYVLPMIWDDNFSDGISRDIFIDAVKAELSEEDGRPDRGVPIGKGYINPLYKMPLFENQFDSEDFPVVEKLQKEQIITTTLHSLPFDYIDLYDISSAFIKVWENRGELNAKS